MLVSIRMKSRNALRLVTISASQVLHLSMVVAMRRLTSLGRESFNTQVPFPPQILSVKTLFPPKDEGCVSPFLPQPPVGRIVESPGLYQEFRNLYLYQEFRKFSQKGPGLINRTCASTA